MKIAKFRLINGTYLDSELLGENTWILSSFLTDEVGPFGAEIKDFINNPKKESRGSNYCFAEKEGADMLIACLFDEDPYENCIRMSQKEFVSIIDQWDNLIKQRPEEIIVYKEGDTYRLEGHGFPEIIT